MYVVGSSPAEFAAFLQHDYDDQDKLMTELGLKAKKLSASFARDRPYIRSTNLLQAEVSGSKARTLRRVIVIHHPWGASIYTIHVPVAIGRTGRGDEE